MNLSENILRLVNDDPAAKMAVDSLSPFGEVYVVGGAPRDVVLGKRPKDIDLMAKVNGDTIESVLKGVPKAKLSLTGKQFPVYRFNYGGSEVEIALPRIEVKTGEGNKDWQIKSDSSIPVEKDLERRDFTANAIAVNAKTGKVVDPFDGLKDIENGVLKTVHPNSFRDDSSRTMRALTALSKHGLQPDEETREQMRLHGPYLKNTPMETIGQELEKILSGNYPSEAIKLGQETGVLEHFLPEVHTTFGFDQKNPYHKHDLGTHLMNVLKNVSGLTNDTDVRMAALLHDIGKPSSMWEDENGVGHFYKGEQGQGANHDEVGAEMAEGILSKLRYPANRISRVKHLINNHMFPTFNSPKGARKFLNNSGSSEVANDLLNLREADHMGKGNEQATRMMVDKMRNLVDNETASQTVFSPKDLAINGNDIIKVLGISAGPQVGEVIKKLMDLVIEHPSLNNRQELLNIVNTLYANKISSKNKFAALHPDFHTGMSKTFKEGQGFTWNSDFSGFDGEGFGVGLNDHGTAIDIRHFDEDDVKRFKNEHAKFLSKNPDVKIGSWNDTKNGKGLVYLDLVRIVPNEMDALRLAQNEQQIAFYDFGSGRVINTQPDIAHEYPIDRDEDDPNPEHLQENYDVNAMKY
jgi:tRNA nucleotidyltransferase (CCA-adding enzyme)